MCRPARFCSGIVCRRCLATTIVAEYNVQPPCSPVKQQRGPLASATALFSNSSSVSPAGCSPVKVSLEAPQYPPLFLPLPPLLLLLLLLPLPPLLLLLLLLLPLPPLLLLPLPPLLLLLPLLLSHSSPTPTELSLAAAGL